MSRFVVLLGFATVLAGAPVSAAEPQGWRVIVYEDNNVARLTAKQVSEYLLKQQTRWEGSGLEVKPIDLHAGSRTRAAFSRAIHGRSVASIKNYWQNQIFSGDGVPPPVAASDSEVIAHVRRHPGAIGYVSAAAVLDGVREVTVVAK